MGTSRLIPVLALVALAGCTDESMPEADEGKRLFTENCAQCHGTSGRGNGPWAASFSPAPTDLTRLSQDGTFPRKRVLAMIDGYDREGLPGQQMPEFGLLLLGETVPVDVGDGVLTPTPRPLAALLAYLEEIQE